MLGCLEVGHHVFILIAILGCIPHVHRVFVALSTSSLGTLVSAAKLDKLFLECESTIGFTDVLGQSLDVDRLFLQQRILIDSRLIRVVREETKNRLSIDTSDRRRKHGVQVAVTDHGAEKSCGGWRGQVKM